MNKEYITKYRIVNNPSYNDFNDELPYTIVAVDYDPNTDLIRQKGFNGWSKISDKLYDTRQECEKHFVFEINYELDNNVADLQHRLEVAEKSLYNLASAVEKESCVYCPIKLGGGERCNANTCKNCKEHKARCELNCLKIIHDDSDGCIDKIVEFYIKQAESEIKGE